MIPSFKKSAAVAIIALSSLPTSLHAEPAPAQAPPPVPSLEAYGDLPGVEEVALSDSGKRIAFVATIKGDRSLLLLEGGKILSKQVLNDIKIRGIEWAGEDRVLLTRTDTLGLAFDFTTNKGEISSTIILPVAGQWEYVFSNEGNIDNMTVGHFGVRYVNGQWTGYYGGIEVNRSLGDVVLTNDMRRSLFAVDMASNTAHRLAPAAGAGHWRDWLVDGAGKVAATLDLTIATGQWKILNSQDQVVTSGRTPDGDIGLVCLGKDGTTVVYWQEDRDGQSDWYEVPLNGGTPQPLLHDVGVDYPLVDRANARLMGYKESGGQSRQIFFDPHRQKTADAIDRAFKGLNVELADWTPDFSTVLVKTNGNADSGTLWQVNIATHTADPIGYERPAIGAAQVGPISVVEYKARDGLEMDGILTLPPGREAKNLPVVMLPHGGPTAQDDPVFDWWAQAFASRGYAVFQPNFRGSTNRGDDFRRAGYGQWGKLMQTDISDGLAELVKRGIVDRKRTCIMGASYGGYAALAGVTLQQGLYRCAVAVAGVSDVKVMYDSDLAESNGSRMTRRSLIESLGDPKLLADVSPRRFAARADAPILLIHGKDDTVVPFSQSTMMADALKEAGKPFGMVVLKEEDHWLSRSATRQQMLEAAMTFVQKYNPAN